MGSNAKDRQFSQISASMSQLIEIAEEQGSRLRETLARVEEHHGLLLVTIAELTGELQARERVLASPGSSRPRTI